MRYFTTIGISIITFGLTAWVWGGQIMPLIVPLLGGVFFVLVLTFSGWFFMVATWGRIVSLFVCGECNSIFLTEIDLRGHYTKNLKNDSEENKD